MGVDEAGVEPVVVDDIAVVEIVDGDVAIEVVENVDEIGLRAHPEQMTMVVKSIPATVINMGFNFGANEDSIVDLGKNPPFVIFIVLMPENLSLSMSILWSISSHYN